MLGWCGFISGERSIITKYIDVIVRVFHYFEVSVSMVPQTKKNGTCPMSTFNSADSGSYILIKLKRITFKEHYYNGIITCNISRNKKFQGMPALTSVPLYLIQTYHKKNNQILIYEFQLYLLASSNILGISSKSPNKTIPAESSKRMTKIRIGMVNGESGVLSLRENQMSFL